MEGCLSHDAFDSCCDTILKQSNKICDNFQIVECKHDPEQKYLVKKTKKVIKGLHGEIQDECECDEADEDKETDQMALNVRNDGSIVSFEHHVVYNESYNVPVMYFIASYQDGKMLTLDELWSLVPDLEKNALKEKWSFITQQEHPFLLRPFFQLHPCHTADFMKVLGSKTSNYLLMWLSAVGPVVNLDLSMEYFKDMT